MFPPCFTMFDRKERYSTQKKKDRKERYAASKE